MTMAPFDELFPALARDELRTIAVLDHDLLLPGPYLLREVYCVEPGCDCRRVLLQIWHGERPRQVATLNYAFEPPKPPFDDEGQLFIDPLNPQSDLSDALLDLVRDMLASDDEYRERLHRHYTTWKEVVDDPRHPGHRKIRSKLHDDPSFRPAFPKQPTVRREGPKVGPNEPCPCGSGKKFKRCCRP
jgi:hypothetical protein